MPPEDNDFEGLLYDVDDPVDEFGDLIDNAELDDDEDSNEPVDPNNKPSALEDEEEPAAEEPPAEEDKPAEEEPVKPTQTPEENAKFAEQRRQREAQELAQREMQNSPEFQIAKLLSDQYGLTPEQLYSQMQESALQRQAEKDGVPVEFLKQQQTQQQETKQLKDQLAKLEFNAWQAQKESEGRAVVEKFKGIVTQDDVNSAMLYMLNELGTTTMSMERAVRVLHGDKIEAELQRIAKQEALAEISGRKQAPLATQGGKASPSTNQLTADEKHFARMMGVSEQDYLKYK